MQKALFFLSILGVALSSCTKEKTDYEAEIDIIIPEYDQFEEAASARIGDYALSIEALNGIFYAGYNEIRVKVTGGTVDINSVTFLPVHTDADGARRSCPHRHALAYLPESHYFSGYAVFTEASGAAGSWALHIGFEADGKAHTATIHVDVEAQTNNNLHQVSFVGHDGRQYRIALVAPQQPTVGENDLVAGIYRLNVDAGTLPQAYAEASGYTLLLDPRMPEASMGNHSSPNNKDLAQRDDGLYQGVVNYTMTGNWTLNFILLDPDGQVVKGTEVPADFTPGVEGTKSELHIDILF